MREHHFSPVDGSTQQEVELAKKFIVDAFGEDWLESKDNATHPIKRLWNRDDALISIEFVSLGKAIQDLQTIDKKWLDKRIQDIKRNAQTAHGYVFEIMALCAGLMVSDTSMRDDFPTRPERHDTKYTT